MSDLIFFIYDSCDLHFVSKKVLFLFYIWKSVGGSWVKMLWTFALQCKVWSVGKGELERIKYSWNSETKYTSSLE
jgi:hypothetical protein